MKIKLKALGDEHPELATTYNGMANVYVTQGKYEEDGPRGLKVLGSESTVESKWIIHTGLRSKGSWRYGTIQDFCVALAEKGCSSWQRYVISNSGQGER